MLRLHTVPSGQRGLSLVELMIGIAIGMIVVAGASLLMTQQVAEHGQLARETQVQQDLRAAADLMLRDIRRGGYWAGAANSVWALGSTVAISPNKSASAPSDQEVTYEYSGDSYGFRLTSEGTIQSKLNGVYQPLTDNTTLKVTELSVVPRSETIDLSGNCSTPCNPATQACPAMTVWRFDITLTGETARNIAGTPPAVRSISISSRVRNDEIVGACPAP